MKNLELLLGYCMPARWVKTGLAIPVGIKRGNGWLAPLPVHVADFIRVAVDAVTLFRQLLVLAIPTVQKARQKDSNKTASNRSRNGSESKKVIEQMMFDTHIQAAFDSALDPLVTFSTVLHSCRAIASSTKRKSQSITGRGGNSSLIETSAR